MIFKQFYLPCLAHASYLIGDESSGTAAVVDPQRDIDQYLAFAAEHGLAIGTSFSRISTPISSPAISSCAIAARPSIWRRAKAEYAFTPLHDGDILEFGRVRLKVLETPGTPRSPSPSWFLISRRGNRALRGAQRRHALHRRRRPPRSPRRARLVGHRPRRHALRFAAHKLLALPDESLVYPAHGAGSLCGKALSKETFPPSANSAAPITLCSP